MTVSPHGKQIIDGYEIDLDHEDAISEGNINGIYIESEKKRIDRERIDSSCISTGNDLKTKILN